ncbi:MAG: flagellar basal body rod protein FlgB [Peptostreptococcaceae bacterium]|nr:flagellar basal body rod protein FlgB [Peptostreptococcaceae bacterium]
MSMQIIGSRDFEILKKAMDTATLRQKTIANNIANVNTKGYKAQKVSFEEAMKSAIGSPKGTTLKMTDQGHMGTESKIESVRPEIVRDESASQRMDGNNVNIESEMVNLAANQLLYSALTQRISNKISVLRYVIHEGRG